ncbi:MAG TPA: hypothetical protein VGQ57_04740 [Polyangiaceae bacterium]|nr:hypothetical protein [Polyangiaceae bacterium]
MGRFAARRERVRLVVRRAGLVVRRARFVVGGALATLAVALALPGCDIVQGFKSAGDALFPSVKTYLDAPGYRLVSGSYRDLVLLTSSELYVLARGTKEGDDSLYSVRYAVPSPCTIPKVGHYWAGGNVDLGVAWIAYFHDNGARGTLSFADTRCHLSALTLEDAELPLDTYITPSENGVPGRMQLLIHAGGQLLIVDPGLPSVEVVAPVADAVWNGSGKNGVSFVLSAGSVQAFDRDWNYIDTFGSDVRSLSPVDGTMFFEDGSGIQRATPTSHDGKLAIDVEVISADGCQLGFPAWAQHWLAFFEPCDEKKLAVLDYDSKELTYPDYTVDDPRALVVSVRAGTVDPPTPAAGVWAFSLRDINYSDGVGTLVVRTPEGSDLVIGERAALERARLDTKADYGFALVDVGGDTGRYVRWDFDGNVTTLAEHVLRESPGVSFADLTVDYDGTSGTLAQLFQGEVIRLIPRIPRRRFAYQDVEHRQAIFSDYDGDNGTLSIGQEACTPGTDCARTYQEPVPVAYGVHHPGHAFLDETEAFLPGIGFLDQFDDELRTGRFQYSNLELGFTSVVSEGVSDFTYAGNGILYAVPYGEGAGIWLARAK